MTRLARWCFTHRWKVTIAWLVAAAAIVGVTAATGTSFVTNLNLPNTDSQAAVALLTRSFPAASGESDKIVIQAAHGTTIRSAPVRGAVTAALARAAQVPGVDRVTSPYGPGGAAQISRDGAIAFAGVTWSRPSAQVTAADATRLIKAAQSADGPDVRVSLGGPAITNSERAGLGRSVGVGVIAALIILLIAFGGAVLAALLPLLTAVLALAIGVSLTGLLSHGLDIASVSTQLAVLIGLGVGVDYGLFIISRHRSGLKAGLSYADAVAQAVRTSGRTVLLAGTTVCIALLGQFALGVSFLYGLSLAAALAVALTMATSLTLLPAMLGFLGPRVLSRRERRSLAAPAIAGPVPGSPVPPALAPGRSRDGFWARWARAVEARKVLAALGALAAVIVVALPIAGLRLGTSDASTDPSGTTTRAAYATLSRGFGPGFNGPLQLVTRTGSPADTAAFRALVAAVSRTPGVVSVTPVVASPDGRVELATVYPASGPQTSRTVDLVNTLRASVLPHAEQGTGLHVHVGGVTATNIDFAHVLTDKLPLFIAVVVVLAFLLLMVVFRSLLIPLVASVMNLLAIGAALGATSAVFSWGWGDALLGVPGRGPVDAFIPVIMFSVLFGLSMDYEVYLVSRMQEEWHQRHHVEPRALTSPGGRGARRNHQAVTAGLTQSGPVIVTAASIMIVVFGSFLLGGHRVLQEFGFGLGFAVLIDVLLIRSVLVPALMHLIGPANWALPAWLDRVLPRLVAEAPDPVPTQVPAPAPGPVLGLPRAVRRDQPVEES
jgi:putative drug exporter of the RND superfamily